MIFDFDGVLADSFDLTVNVCNELAIEEGRKSRVTKKDIRILGAKAIIKRDKIPFYKIPNMLKKARKKTTARIDTIKTFPGVKSMLSELKSGKNFAILTSNSRNNVVTFLNNNKIINLFDHIEGDVGIFGKTKGIRKIIKKYKTPNEEIICIGDEIRDVEAAEKSNLKCVAVTWGYSSKKLLAKSNPDHIVSTPDKLVTLIKKLNTEIRT